MQNPWKHRLTPAALGLALIALAGCDAAEQSALNRQGITENARRVKELEREVAELKALVAKLVDER